jgi:hypothetical protein
MCGVVDVIRGPTGQRTDNSSDDDEEDERQDEDGTGFVASGIRMTRRPLPKFAHGTAEIP